MTLNYHSSKVDHEQQFSAKQVPLRAGLYGQPFVSLQSATPKIDFTKNIQ